MKAVSHPTRMRSVRDRAIVLRPCMSQLLHRCLATLAATVLSALTAHGATYHVSTDGNDASPGTLGAPWRTVAKVNGLNLPPGTTVLFRAGDVFDDAGLQVFADDAGDAANPVVIGSYGAGRATIRPPAGWHGVDIYNTGGVVVENLSFQGVGRDTSTRFGVQAYCDLPGNTRLPAVIVRDCEIFHFRKGIEVGAWPVDSSFSGFNDLRIERCLVRDCRREGIATYGFYPGSAANQSHRNLVVRDCEVFGVTGDPAFTANHSGSGIVVSGIKGGLVERCYAHHNGGSSGNSGAGSAVGIWMWGCDSVVIQDCLVHDQRVEPNKYDGGGFDIDGGATNSTIQYCYSYNNDGPGYLVAQFNGAPPMSGLTLRYNISIRDGRYQGRGVASGFHFFRGSGSNTPSDVAIYNNLVYSEATEGSSMFHQAGAFSNVRFFNNIFIVRGGRRFVWVNSDAARNYFTFRGNAYWAADADYSGGWRWGANTTFTSLAAWRAAFATPEMLGGQPVGWQTDPLLNALAAAPAPVSVAEVAALTAFRLRLNSPLRNAALDLRGAQFGSLSIGARDFFGNPLPTGAPDVGPHEFRVPLTYADFQAAWFTPQEIADGLAAPAQASGAGVPNIVAYALGWNPRTAASRPALTAERRDGNITATAILLGADRSLAASWEVSPDLQAWEAPHAGSVTRTRSGDFVSSDFRMDPADTPSFARIRLVLPP